MKQLKKPNNGTILTCSVCGKEFTVTDDTMYICHGGFTCSWQCFLNFVNSRPPKNNKTK